MRAGNVFCRAILLILWNTLALVQAGNATESPSGKIAGRVLDDQSGNPVSGVNVFLSNTMLGDATDEDGRFEIVGVPDGIYELVVTHVGYLFEKESVEVRGRAGTVPVLFRIIPQVWVLREVEVTAEMPEIGAENLKTLTHLFLGDTRNANKCRILNPEVLAITNDEMNDVFTARARDALIIENRALGYRIDYVLASFRASGDEVRYVGSAAFHDLQPKDGKEKKRWEKTRRKTYEGSLRHFLASLCDGSYRKTGFVTQVTPFVPANLTPILGDRVDPSGFVSPGEEPSERRLSCHDVLQVIYTRERADRDYLDWAGRRRESGTLPLSTSRFPRQSSWLVMQHVVADMDRRGFLHHPLAVKVYGYWAWERIADMLPYEYTIEKN